MDRCALFVDAGYALSDGALAVHGTRHRDSVSWDYAGLLKLLAELARDRTGLPVLRCYWYEATVDSRRTPEHETLADIPGVKLRLGKVRPGRREGVETEIRRDLTALARNKAVTDVLIVSAEEDLSQVISDVQDQGIKVAILHISGDGDETASRALRQECDDVIEISAQHLRPYVDLIPGAEPAARDHDASRYAASAVSGGGVSGGTVSGGAVSAGAGSGERTLSGGSIGGTSGTPQREPATAGAASSSLYPAPVAADYSRVGPPGGSAPSATEPGQGSGGHGVGGQGSGGQGSGSPMAGSPAMASSGGSMNPGSADRAAAIPVAAPETTERAAPARAVWAPETWAPETWARGTWARRTWALGTWVPAAWARAELTSAARAPRRACRAPMTSRPGCPGTSSSTRVRTACADPARRAS